MTCLAFLIFTTISSTFGFPPGPVSVLGPTLACHRTCSESGHIETSQKCVLTTQGVKWKWNSGLVDHLQTS